MAIEYFREIFTSTNRTDFDSLFDGFETRVLEEMNQALTAPVSDEEVKLAAFIIKDSSGPGAMGSLVNFTNNSGL